MTDATIGYNDEFWLHNGTALTELAEVKSFSFPEATTDDVEATSLKSPGRMKEYVPGLIDNGEFTVTMNYVPGSVTDLLCQAALAAADIRPWKMGITDKTSVVKRNRSGTGYVKGYKPDDISVGELKTATLTIKVSGAVTEAAAA